MTYASQFSGPTHFQLFVDTIMGGASLYDVKYCAKTLKDFYCLLCIQFNYIEKLAMQVAIVETRIVVET